MLYGIAPGLRSRLAVGTAAALILGAACGADDSADGNPAGDAGSGQQADAGGGAGSSGQAGDAAAPEVQVHPDCDLSGKWISAQRTLSIAVGIQGVRQSGHNWGYWEFEQDGTEAVVTRGLRCGFQVVDRSTTLPTEVHVSQAVWDGEATHSFNDGRRAVYGATGSDECYLQVEQRYLVRGATVDYFIDPAVDLAEAAEPATDTTPGWEDWDEDGHPGVTFTISGLASGAIYVVQRDWNEYEGLTPRGADKFRVDVTWNTEQVTISKEPPQLPSADSVSSTEPGDNFIWFARLDGVEQWDVADDADVLTVCARVRELKDQLLPEGNQ
jgi:hypothetical protein